MEQPDNPTTDLTGIPRAFGPSAFPTSENNKLLSPHTWKQTRSNDGFGNFAVAALDFLLYVSVNEVEGELQFNDASSLSSVDLGGGGKQRFTVNLVVTNHTPPTC